MRPRAHANFLMRLIYGIVEELELLAHDHPKYALFLQIFKADAHFHAVLSGKILKKIQHGTRAQLLVAVEIGQAQFANLLFVQFHGCSFEMCVWVLAYGCSDALARCRECLLAP